MKKIIILLMVIVSIYSASALDIQGETHQYNLNCYYPTNHYLKMDDGVLRVNCFVDSNNVSCVSKIYSMINTTSYDEILQVNPDVYFSDDINPFFTPENKQINVYFNKKNLLLDSQYLYSVECSGDLGIDVSQGYVTVKNNKLVQNIGSYFVSYKENAYYWLAFAFLVIIIIIALAYFYSLWRISK